MKGKIFIDTNVLVYLYSVSEKEKQFAAQNLINKNNQEIIISTQVLGEFINVLYRKYDYPIETIKKAITDFKNNFEVSPIYTKNVEKSLEVMKKFKFTYWDSMIIASALENKCSILYSEDLQHNQKIEKTLKIINPFREEPGTES